MHDLALILGYAVLMLGGVLLALGLLFLTLHLTFHYLNTSKRADWVMRAMRHYQTVEPMDPKA